MAYDAETQAMLDRPYEYREFPKMLHHPDGSTATVFHESQQSGLLGTGWHTTPGAALAAREEIDERTAKADIVAAAKARG